VSPIPDFVIDSVCLVPFRFLNKPRFMHNRREINPLWLRNGMKTCEKCCKIVLTGEKSTTCVCRFNSSDTILVFSHIQFAPRESG